MTLFGRVALVTGGTGALGQAVTLRLLAEGAAVAVPWITDHAHAALLARVAPAARDRLTTARTDVTDPAAMESFVRAVLERHGRIDVLAALVGGFAPGRLLETDRGTWDRMLRVNLTSTFTAARAVVPHMVAAGRGRVITVGSRAVVPPGPGFIAYTAAKAGVIAFSLALAEELRGSGVTVNCVLPSTLDTPANRAAMPGADPRRWVPVESVANLVAYLARDESAHLTGALLTV
jgi:NAD(P)-dependent dehydrogenase (short-subunit alcohol dehydrogenase family)